MPPENKKDGKTLKVLWFVNTPSLAAEKYGIKVMSSGSWIAAAETQMSKRQDIDLAVAFITPYDQTRKFIYQNRTYYSIHQKNQFLRVRGYLGRITHSINLQKMSDLRWVVEDFKPDIIHIYGSEGPFGLIAKQTKVPVVLRIQGILQVCQDVVARDLSPWQMFLKTKITSLIFGYGPFHFYLSFRRKADREKKIFEAVKYYIGQTDWDENMIHLLSPMLKYFRLSPAVRKEFFRYRWRQKRNRKLSILSVISPNPYKGLEEVLAAAKILKNAKVAFSWKIAGVAKNDPYIRAFGGAKSDAYLKNNVHFLGVLDEKELIGEHLKSDLYVHPSHIENESLSIIEAMILGVPTIANFVGGIGTYLEDGKSGIMVQDRDPQALSAAIVRLKDDPALSAHLGKSAREKLLEKLDHQSLSGRLAEIYREILHLEAKKKIK